MHKATDGRELAEQLPDPRGNNPSPKPQSVIEFEDAYEYWKKEWKDNTKHTEALSQVRKAWITPFLEQERLCVATLQRRACEQRILRDGEYQFYNGAESTRLTDKDKEQILEDIEELTRMYWDYNGKLSTMWSNRPRALNVTELEILRGHKTPNGRTYAWVMDRGRCADWGGCCARGCGCCGKALFRYQRPSGIGNIKEEVLVFGHCTLECDCCGKVGRANGDPHPGLATFGFFSTDDE